MEERHAREVLWGPVKREPALVRARIDAVHRTHSVFGVALEIGMGALFWALVNAALPSDLGNGWEVFAEVSAAIAGLLCALGLIFLGSVIRVSFRQRDEAWNRLDELAVEDEGHAIGWLKNHSIDLGPNHGRVALDVILRLGAYSLQDGVPASGLLEEINSRLVLEAAERGEELTGTYDAEATAIATANLTPLLRDMDTRGLVRMSSGGGFRLFTLTDFGRRVIRILEAKAPPSPSTPCGRASLPRAALS